jgi:hypothetical protein
LARPRRAEQMVERRGARKPGSDETNPASDVTQPKPSTWAAGNVPSLELPSRTQMRNHPCAQPGGKRETGEGL